MAPVGLAGGGARGVAWIPIQLAIVSSWGRELFGLTYVEWNRLMVVPLGLVLAATVGLVVTSADSRRERIGARLIAVGLAGMLTGNLVEFYLAGGLAGNAELAGLGWGVYLLPGMLVHVIGLMTFGIGFLRSGRRQFALGGLALAIALLHLVWVSAGASRSRSRSAGADRAGVGRDWRPATGEPATRVCVIGSLLRLGKRPVSGW